MVFGGNLINIYYLYNSGFTLELDAPTGGLAGHTPPEHGAPGSDTPNRDALIFDYWRGGLGKPWRMPLDAAPSGYRNVYVFVSHIHADHYNREIFNWLSERDDIHYILSDDIKRSAQSLPAVKGKGRHTVDFIACGGRLRVGALDVTAYGSTDTGVSFHVVAEGGISIFHAGDLNFWHWRDASTAAEVAAADELFTMELNRIRLGIKKIDVAFFPVDPRMGSDYYRGAIRFCEAMKPSVLVPMHCSTKSPHPNSFFTEIKPYTKVVFANNPVGSANAIPLASQTLRVCAPATRYRRD